MMTAPVAVEALAQIAEKGDAQAIAAGNKRLEDSDRDVRRATVEAFAELAEISPVSCAMSAP